MELTHHGILGQRWGVRRYQDENGRLTEAGKEHLKTINTESKHDNIKGDQNLRIVAGTEMYRISSTKTDSDDTRYVSYRPNDRKFYKGYWRHHLKTPEIYEQTYKTASDLFIPSAKTRREILSTMMENDDAIKALYGDKYSEEIKAAHLNYVSTLSETYRARQMAKHLGGKKDLLTIYGKEVLDRGFNAVIDDNGALIGEMPLILFTANESMVRLGAEKVDEIVQNKSKKQFSKASADRYKRHNRNAYV